MRVMSNANSTVAYTLPTLSQPLRAPDPSHGTKAVPPRRAGRAPCAVDVAAPAPLDQKLARAPAGGRGRRRRVRGGRGLGVPARAAPRCVAHVRPQGPRPCHSHEALKHAPVGRQLSYQAAARPHPCPWHAPARAPRRARPHLCAMTRSISSSISSTSSRAASGSRCRPPPRSPDASLSPSLLSA